MNELADRLQQAEALVAAPAEAISRPENNRLDIVIPAEALLGSVQALQQAHWGYLAAITGLDHPGIPPTEGEPAPEGHVEAIYSFCNGPAVLNLRVRLPYSHPVVPSVCGLIPSATLYERELMEMFGVTIEGTPDTSRLILADAWPEGVYPLRKSFTHSASDVEKLKGA